PLRRLRAGGRALHPTGLRPHDPLGPVLLALRRDLRAAGHHPLRLALDALRPHGPLGGTLDPLRLGPALRLRPFGPRRRRPSGRLLDAGGGTGGAGRTVLRHGTARRRDDGAPEAETALVHADRARELDRPAVAVAVVVAVAPAVAPVGEPPAAVVAVVVAAPVAA